MAVREFTDSRGKEWRVWDVTPEHMHPVTRSEDYMANYQDGWLAFESGPEKRRLEAPYPADWITLSIPALEALCRSAKLVARRGAQTDTGKLRNQQATETERHAMEAAHAQITFRSPRGREWTVRVHECLDAAGDQQTVLRFTAGDVVVELPQWPDGWQSATMQDFAVMLLDANPPRRRKKGEGPQRRHDDHLTPGDVGPADTAPRAP
jgi:hypothetical protein